MRVNIIAPWFVRTRIISDEVQELLVDRGVTFAEKGDAARAVLRFAADESINGEYMQRTAGRGGSGLFSRTDW